MKRLIITVLISLSLTTSAEAITYDNFMPIDYPGAFSTGTSGINNAGTIIGTYYNSMDGRGHGFIYDGATYTTIDDYPNSYFTAVQDINDANRIVGTYSPSIFGLYQGFIYDNGTFNTFAFPESLATHISGINNVGGIVGNYRNLRSEYHSFWFDGNAFLSVHYPNSRDTWVSDINDNGNIVGTYVDLNGVSHGFLFKPDGGFTTSEEWMWDSQIYNTDFATGEFTTFDPPNSTGTGPTKINNNNQVVGVYSDIMGSYGFLLDGNNFYTINYPPNSTNSYITGINDVGQITGGYGLGGYGRSYIATPVPEPSTLLLLGSGLAGMVLWMRNGRKVL